MPEATERAYPKETRREADGYALALMLFFLMSSIALSLVPIVRSQLEAAPFSLSDSQLGLLTSVFMLTFSIGALPGGMAAARWGGPTLLVGAACLVAGSVLFAASSSYPWFLVARFLQGAGGSASIPGANALIARTVTPRYQGRALGIVGCGHGLGVLTALLVMPSIQKAAGFRAVFLATAGIVAAFAALASLQGEIRHRGRRSGNEATLAGLLRAIGSIATNPRMLLLWAVNVGIMAIFVGILAWTPAFLHDQRGQALAVAAYLTAGLGLAQAVGNASGAWAMGRWGKPAVLVGGMLVMCVATALVPVVPGTAAVFVCVAIAGFLTMAMFPATMGSITEVVSKPEQVGPASGAMNVVSLLGTLFAPWLFGVLLDSRGTAPGTSGYLWGYLLLALFALMGTAAAVTYLIVGKRAIRAASTGAPDILAGIAKWPREREGGR